MKLAHKLMAGLFLIGATQLAAQSGLTPNSGINPLDQESRAAQSAQRLDHPDSPLNGNAQLGPAWQGSECGLNYTTATQKLGQRFFPVGVPQPANFNITVPAGAIIVKAFVWCDASGNGAPITINVTNPLAASFSVPMTLVGSDVDKCWGRPNSTTYRADITATISTPPSGTYQLSGFPVGGVNDVDGATMVVIWKDPTANFQGDLVIWDGAFVGLGVPVSGTMNGFLACPNGTVSNARAFMGIGDLQGLGSQLTLNGFSPYTVVEDWWNFIDVPTTVFPGQNTSVFGNNVVSDCYNIAVYGLYFQSTCKTCDFPCDAKPEFKWNGCNPVQFDGRNDGVSPVVSWYWQFGDGGTSTLEDPLHTYGAAGTYTVCLTIISVSSKGETCCNQICHKVDVCPPPPCSVKPDFHWNSTASNPLQVSFTDATTYTGGVPCAYKVDFGDGSPTYFGSSMPSYHIYPGFGTWEMCMVVTVCTYDANGNVIDKCEEKICHKIKIDQGGSNGRVAQPAQTSPNTGIDVFPNPAKNIVNVTVQDEQTVVVRILNASGQEVAIARATGKNTYEADLTSLAAGVYFVTVQGADGVVRRELFVKE